MPLHPIGNRDLIRAINRSAVLNAVKTHGPISRTQIAQRTRLSPAAITGITAELIRSDLVYEKAPGDSRGGRRPILLALQRRGRCVVGLKLTETQVIGALTDLEATVLSDRTTTLRGRSPEAVVKSLADAVTGLLKSGKVLKKRLLGVGLGLAGIIDAERGILRQSPYFGWRDLPLPQMLQQAIGAAVYADNDVNTLTMAERWFGAGQGVDDFLTITIGRGVGLGIVANGQFYRGGRGGAGEFGHTVLDPEGPACDCGKRGCLEAFVGDPALLRMYAEAVGRSTAARPAAPARHAAVPPKDGRSGETRLPASPEQLAALAQSGNPLARSVYARAGDMLGRGVANLINLFDPQLILISGEGVRAGEWLFGPMRQTVERHVMPGLAGGAEIRIHAWDDNAWARGAASLVLRQLFESPVHRTEVLPA